MDKLTQLQLLLSQPTRNTTDIQSLYNGLAQGGQVPLDDPTMLWANPQLAQALGVQSPTVDQNLMVLENLLSQVGANDPRTKALYTQLTDQGVPNDHPMMLKANPELAQALAAAAVPQPAPFIGQRQDTQRQAPAPAPAQAPAPQGNPYEYWGDQLSRSMLGIIPSMPEAPDLQNTLGAFLYGLFGDQPILNQKGAGPQKAPTAPVIGQMPAPVAAPVQAPVQQPVQAPVAAPAPAPQVQAAAPTDIASALLSTQQTQQTATQAPSMTPDFSGPTQEYDTSLLGRFTSNPKFMTLLQDVLMGVASNPNWDQGIVSGLQANSQRGLAEQQRFMQNLLLQNKMGVGLSEMQKNFAQARNYDAASNPNSAESQKTQAEINRIKAETALARAREAAVGKEKSFTDQNYTQALTDIYKSISEQDMLLPEGSEDSLFSADFRSRETLNKLGGQVARYVPLSGDTKQVLDSSFSEYQAGNLSKDQLAARIARAQTVHGPAAIEQYIRSLRNEPNSRPK